MPVVPVSAWVVALVVAVTPVVVMVIDWLLSNFGAQIPALIKPILATALGALGSYLAGVNVADPVIMALIGLASIGVREIIDQLGKVTGVKAALFGPK